MTELTIVPNLDRKSLKLHGAIAAGEHVKVTVVGGADLVSPDGETQTLRLRFIFCDRVVAAFPTVTVANVSADDTGTLTPQDITAWHTSADDAEIAEGDAVCELNLNTTTAEKYLKFGGNCLVVLDDIQNDTLYGVNMHEVRPWPYRNEAETPENLDDAPVPVTKYLATWVNYDDSATTTLAIEPDYGKKSLKFHGAVASGEHVRVTVKGGAAWASAEGAALRLRVLFGCKQVAMFPVITAADVEADTTETLTSEDVMSWDTTSGEDAVCTLNFNTVPAEKHLKFGGNCLFILDDAENHTLYGMGEFDVMPWPKRNGADVPYNLDEYPDIVAELQEAWAAYQTELNAAWEAHQQEVATAIASKANASDLTSHVGNTSNPHSVTKAQVGLGNVDNTADANKPISTATQNALDGKADKSATYTKQEVDAKVAAATPSDYDAVKGRVSAVEGKVPSEASASNQLADKAYVGTEIASAISAVTDGAPEAFDTLKEIADWIGDEGSGAQQVIDQVANKVDKVEGKGLSTNDFTTAEKEKLAGIAAGATAVTVDSALSGSSANPVENRAVSEALAGKFDKADEDVQVSFDDENMGLKVADYADLYHVVLHIKGIIANWADGNDKKFLFPSHPPSNKTTLALLQNIAPDFSTSASYAVDDLCVRSGQLFRCTAAHAPDDWNFDHFQPATVQDVLASLCSVVAARPTKTSDLQNDGDGTHPFATTADISAAITVDGELSDTSANPVQNRVVKAALDERPTKAQMDEGWWTEWTVTPPTYNGVPIVVDKIVGDGRWAVFLSTEQGRSFSDSLVMPNEEHVGDGLGYLQWSAGESWGSGVTATRKRVAAPIPLRTSDLVNDGDGSSYFATVAQLAEKASLSDLSDLRDYVDSAISYTNITASLSITDSSPSPGAGESQTVREKGRTVTQVSFLYNFNKVPVEAKFGTSNPPTEEIADPGTYGIVSKTGLLVSTSTTWRISGKEAATPGKIQQTATASATINFYNGVYYGVAADATPDSAFVLGLANKRLQSSRVTSFTVNAGTGQYIWYALPVSMGACAFKVGGFDGGFALVSTFDFTNAAGHAEPYRVYRSDNPSLGNTTVSVSAA